MRVAIGATRLGRLTAEMKTGFAGIADWPLTKPIDDRIQHRNRRFRWRTSGRQTETVRFADHRVPGDMAQRFRYLSRRQSFPP